MAEVHGAFDGRFRGARVPTPDRMAAGIAGSDRAEAYPGAVHAAL